MIYKVILFLITFSLIPIKDNPFTAIERKLPIEFPYVQSVFLNVNITIPEGYVVEEKFKGARIETPNKEISCNIKCFVDNKTSFVQFKLDINSSFFGVCSADSVFSSSNTVPTISRISELMKIGASHRTARATASEVRASIITGLLS